MTYENLLLDIQKKEAEDQRIVSMFRECINPGSDSEMETISKLLEQYLGKPVLVIPNDGQEDAGIPE